MSWPLNILLEYRILTLAGWKIFTCGPLWSARFPGTLFPDPILLRIVHHFPSSFSSVRGGSEEFSKAIYKPFGFLIKLQGGAAISAEVQDICLLQVSPFWWRWLAGQSYLTLPTPTRASSNFAERALWSKEWEGERYGQKIGLSGLF